MRPSPSCPQGACRPAPWPSALSQLPGISQQPPLSTGMGIAWDPSGMSGSLSSRGTFSVADTLRQSQRAIFSLLHESII